MLQKEAIELRPSKKEEVTQAVPLIYSSGPDAFEFVFKNHKVSAQDFLRFAYTREGGEFSYKNHYSLYQGEKMVGIGSIFSAKEAARFMIPDAKKIFQFYGIKGFGIAIRGLRIETIIKHPVKNEVAIAHLGIAPELRGQGLGTKLIEQLKQRAKQPDDVRFVLDVSEENPKAKSLYERLGFVVTKTYPLSLRNQFSYVPEHSRMELIEE